MRCTDNTVHTFAFCSKFLLLLLQEHYTKECTHCCTILIPSFLSFFLSHHIRSYTSYHISFFFSHCPSAHRYTPYLFINQSSLINQIKHRAATHRTGQRRPCPTSTSTPCFLTLFNLFSFLPLSEKDQVERRAMCSLRGRFSRRHFEAIVGKCGFFKWANPILICVSLEIQCGAITRTDHRFVQSRLR